MKNVLPAQSGDVFWDSQDACGLTGHSKRQMQLFLHDHNPRNTFCSEVCVASILKRVADAVQVLSHAIVATCRTGTRTYALEMATGAPGRAPAGQLRHDLSGNRFTNTAQP